MKVTLKPNAELELLTPGELKTILAETLAGWRRTPITVRPIEAGHTDGSGNANGLTNGIKLFEVPPGYSFRLHRVRILPEGYTFGVPYTSATGYAEIARAQHMEDGISFTSPGLPVIWSAGTADGIFYNNGEIVRIDIFGGPASTNILLRGQGTLQPIEVNPDF